MVHKQKGAVEIVLVLLLVAALGLAGWFWKNNGKFCAGIAGVKCPVGFSCQTEGNYPDAGGKCVSVFTLAQARPSPTPSTSTMTDWRVHEDKTGTFEIKIPRGWRIVGESSRSIESTFFSQDAVINDPGVLGKGSRLEITEIKNPQDLSLEQWWDGSYFSGERKKTSVGGEDGFISHGSAGKMSLSHAAIAWQGKILHFRGESFNQQNFSDLFDQILSTFKFLD